MPRVIACVERSLMEINEAHRPDNGLIATALEITTLDVLLGELQGVLDCETGMAEEPAGMNYIKDDFVVGNSDKMLFFAKEL